VERAHSTNWAEKYQFFVNPEPNPYDIRPAVWNQGVLSDRNEPGTPRFGLSQVAFDQVMDYTVISEGGPKRREKYRSGRKMSTRWRLPPKPTAESPRGGGGAAEQVPILLLIPTVGRL